MKAAVLYGRKDLRIEEIPIPEVSDHEILVKVKATGICGSDLPRVLSDEAHYYPIVLGHEYSGIVERVGSKVSKVKAGDRIAGAPLLPCHRCSNCQKGNYAQCNNYSFIGSRINGSWAEYVKMPEINAVKISDDVSYEEAAFFEPAAVALHALQHINYEPGENVAILGGGNIGLLTLQWTKLLGAKSVTVFDIDNEKLELAKKLGADHVINTLENKFEGMCKNITNDEGFGIVLETAGSIVTMNLSFEIAKNKAKICFVGTPTKDVTFDYKLFEKMNRKEFILTGSWMSYSAPFPGKEWDMTAHFLAKKQLNFKDLIFKTLPLEKMNDAFNSYQTPGLIKGKIIIVNK